jgi:type I restriction enzyme S subunit
MMFYKEISFKNEPLIGEIPQDWGCIELGKVVEIHDSQRIPLSEMERKNRKGPYPYCGANGIIDYIDDYIFDGEFVLLAEDGGSYGKFESTAYIMNGKFWVNNHAHVLQAIEGKTTNLFLKYVLDFLDLNPYVVGSTRKKLNQEQMREIKIPYPPLEEQRAVAGVLGVVDSVIAKTDEVIAKTERLKKGLMQTLLTRGIGHKEFKETEIGKIPKTWQIVSLGDVCEQRSEIVQPSADNKEPFVGLEHIASGETRLRNFAQSIDVKSAKFRFYAGDILYGKLRPYLDKAVLADLNGICSTDLLVLKPKNNVIKEFLIYVLHSTDFIKHAIATTTGTNHPRTSWTAISKFKFGLPEHSEQQNIANILSTIDRKLELEKKEKVRLERIKRGLMDLLLTGKIRVKVY